MLMPREEGPSERMPAEIWDTARGPSGEYRHVPREARSSSLTRLSEGFRFRGLPEGSGSLDGPPAAARQLPEAATSSHSRSHSQV